MSGNRPSFKIQIPDTTPETTERPQYSYIDLVNTENIISRVDDPETPFSYDQILSKIYITRGKYRVGKSTETYYSLSLINLPTQGIRENGLKIQISLDDEVTGNVAKGWNAIVSILCYYNVARIKVVDINKVGIDKNQSPTEQGKQITIYAALHPDGSNWQNILISITRALIENDVRPGYRPDAMSSKELTGNCYISYRDDWDPDAGVYRPARLRTGAFPKGVLDPLVGYDIPTPGMEVKSLSTSSAASAAVSATEPAEPDPTVRSGLRG